MLEDVGSLSLLIPFFSLDVDIYVDTRDIGSPGFATIIYNNILESDSKILTAIGFRFLSKRWKTTIMTICVFRRHGKKSCLDTTDCAKVVTSLKPGRPRDTDFVGVVDGQNSAKNQLRCSKSKGKMLTTLSVVQDTVPQQFGEVLCFVPFNMTLRRIKF